MGIQAERRERERDIADWGENGASERIRRGFYIKDSYFGFGR